MVIFGAGGDLSKRLLVPALYNLAHADLLDDDFKVIGVARAPFDDATLRSQFGDFLQLTAANNNSEFGPGKIDSKVWGWLAKRIFYQSGDFDDDARLGTARFTMHRANGKAAALMHASACRE